MSFNHRGLRRAVCVAIGVAVAGITGTVAYSQSNADAKVLRVVPHADLSGLDPTVSSDTITADHSYLVYDTLFGLDESMTPRPQMVESFSVSPDKQLYRFTLRDGLLFHDGSPVTAEDCVASIKRWAVN